MIPVSEPPAIILESSSSCSDMASADALLRRTIGSSLAPHGGWTIRVRVARDAGSLRAEGDVNDENDNTVAHRAIARVNDDCNALVRAVGVWATLVLDAEVIRATEVETHPTRTFSDDRREDSRLSRWPSFVSQDEDSANGPRAKSIEVGSSAFMMSGTAAGSMAGSSIFSLIELENDWYLRPIIEVGRTIEQLPSGNTANMGAARFEVCKRVTGPYTYRRGIEFDMCGEVEGGAFDGQGTAQLRPILATGPTAGLHGDLGESVAVELRGGVGLNVLRPSPVVPGDGAVPSLLASRIELAVSWKIR